MRIDLVPNYNKIKQKLAVGNSEKTKEDLSANLLGSIAGEVGRVELVGA